MYAIIDVGGKQYKAEKGKTIKMDLLEKQIGDAVEFKSILISGDDKKLQTSPNSKVFGKVVDICKGRKVVVFKKRPKKGYKKTIGHRQDYTEVEITGIGS
ncbi:MAG: 50S ribosomal protein L21 [Elusimicrobia bacterium]|nr:50S ribosomal protein L21 [Elusimicrobiota bacterium]